MALYEDLMDEAAFLKALRSCGAVYAWVNLFSDDGDYVQLTKAAAREAVQGCRDGIRARVVDRGGAKPDLFIG